MGLLDVFDTIGGQQALGLLAAAGPRSDGAGFGQRLSEGLGAADQWKMRQAKMAQEAQHAKMQQMQMAQVEAQLAQQQKMQGLAQQFATPGGFDYNGYTQAMAGIDPIRALELQKSLAKQGPEFSTAPQYDQTGRAFILAKDGSMKYLDGVKARDKLQEVRLGDKVGFRTDYSPELQGSLAIGQDANSKASNAVTMRGQNMTDLRARDLNAISQDANNIKRGEKQAEKDQAKAGQVASFDVMLGSLDRLSQHPGLARSVGLTGAFPTMPGSESANFKAELDTFQSQAFIPMVSQLKGMGALSDAEGKKLTAAVGALNPSMGEKAFRESVARITGDMNAARDRVTGSQPAQKPMEALPTANASNKGRKIRDTITGKVLTSNGMSWVEDN